MVLFRCRSRRLDNDELDKRDEGSITREACVQSCSDSVMAGVALSLPVQRSVLPHSGKYHLSDVPPYWSDDVTGRLSQ